MEMHRYAPGLISDVDGEYTLCSDYEEMLQTKNQTINKLCVLLKDCAGMMDRKYVLYDTGEPFADYILRTVAEAEERSEG